MQELMCEAAGLSWSGLRGDRPDGADVGLLLVHGNLSSGEFWRETISGIEDRVFCVAPDLRGFGRTRAASGALGGIEAATALADWAAELSALTAALSAETGIRRWVWAGWSMGGGVVASKVMNGGPELAGAVLVNPVAPRGFGGTQGLDGQLNSDDGAGSGGGCANPAFVEKLAAGDRGDEQFSARGVMRALYFGDGFALPADREDVLVDAMLETRLGHDFYPGDMTPSANWPAVAPGGRGILNALSPLHCDWRGIVDAAPKPPVLWVRGSRDKIVADMSFVDFGTLGQLGYVPGWPGAAACPPQPMVAQTSATLDAYAAAGGRVERVEFDCGHSPMLEMPDAFQAALAGYVHSVSRVTAA